MISTLTSVIKLRIFLKWLVQNRFVNNLETSRQPPCSKDTKIMMRLYYGIRVGRQESEAKTKHDYVAHILQVLTGTCALELGENKQLRQERSKITDAEKDEQGKRSACIERDAHLCFQFSA